MVGNILNPHDRGIKKSSVHAHRSRVHAHKSYISISRVCMHTRVIYSGSCVYRPPKGMTLYTGSGQNIQGHDVKIKCMNNLYIQNAAFVVI